MTPKIPDSNADSKIVDSKIDERKFKQVNRRELLKLSPVIALGAFAIPSLREPLLKQGLGFSDWASAKLFRSGHLAPTFADSDLTPFEKFPVNDYDVDDPELWRKSRPCREPGKTRAMSASKAGT